MVRKVYDTILFSFLFGFISIPLAAQDDLFSLLDETQSDSTTINYTIGTFKSTRIVNGHSVNFEAKGELQFLIQHRFGTLNSGGQRFWGLDDAFIRLGLEYGLLDRFAIGIGRSSVDGIVDGYQKFSLMRQSSGARNNPLSIVLFNSFGVFTRDFPEQDRDYQFRHRMTYSHQLLIARKFSDRFSLQLMPTLVHRNLVETAEDNNDIFALGAAGRIKITKRFTFTAEYFQIFDDRVLEQFEHPLSFGFEIQTGGHVFQLHLSNTRGMIAQQYLTQTTGKWGDGDIHFGFNVSRVFNINSK